MNRLAKAHARLQAMSWGARRAFAAAIVLLPVCWISLRIWNFARLYEWLGQRSLRAPAISADEVTAVAQAVDLAARHHPFPATCLTRSLVLLWLLRGRGLSSELRVGVQLQDGALNAHAWLERDGSPLNERPEVVQTFSILSAPFGADAFTAR